MTMYKGNICYASELPCCHTHLVKHGNVVVLEVEATAMRTEQLIKWIGAEATIV